MSEIMESYEVVDQRVRDLSTYVREAVPGLFDDGAAAAIKYSKLEYLLGELDEEFSYSDLHRMQMFAAMATRITGKIEPILESAVVKNIETLNPSDEELEEWVESGGLPGPLIVMWDELFPVFDIGELPVLFHVGGVAVTGMLNAALWEDAAWDDAALTLLSHLPEVFDKFLGIVGLIMFVIYIHVVELGALPDIRYVHNN